MGGKTLIMPNDDDDNIQFFCPFFYSEKKIELYTRTNNNVTK